MNGDDETTGCCVHGQILNLRAVISTLGHAKCPWDGTEERQPAGMIKPGPKSRRPRRNLGDQGFRQKKGQDRGTLQNGGGLPPTVP